MLARIANDPNAAMLEWYKQARIEFGDLIGRDCAHKAFQFSWRLASCVTNQATDSGVSTMLSRIWRTLEQKARLVCRVALDGQRSKYNEHAAFSNMARSMITAYHLKRPTGSTWFGESCTHLTNPPVMDMCTTSSWCTKLYHLQWLGYRDEVKEAIRRRRWKETDSVLPGLLPTTADGGIQHAHARRTVWVPCITIISTLLKGKPCPRNAGPVGDL